MGPVDLELLKIKKKWYQELNNNKETPLFICLGGKHEIDLLEGYFKSCLSDESTNDDVYLMHYQPFESSLTYGQRLLDEWNEAYQLWCKSDDSIQRWDINTDTKVTYKTDAYKAFFALQQLNTLYPALRHQFLFVYIAPEKVSDFGQLYEWMNEWCKLSQDTPNIKLVIADNHERRCVKSNAYAHEWRVEVDLHQLMQNTAAHSNRSKNSTETDFQQQVLMASNYMSKQKYEEANFALERAIHIASTQQLKEGEIAAMFMLAQCYSVQKEKQKAEQTFQELLVKAGNNNKLAVQMNMHYATFLLTQSQKNKALEHYEHTLKMAEAIEDLPMQMECCRIIGQLSDGLLGSSKTIRYYEQCIEIARRLPDDEQREQSSMGYVALLLLKKYGGSDKGQVLDNEMTTYLGNDWKTNFQTAPQNSK